MLTRFQPACPFQWYCHSDQHCLTAVNPALAAVHPLVGWQPPCVPNWEPKTISYHTVSYQLSPNKFQRRLLQACRQGHPATHGSAHRALRVHVRAVAAAVWLSNGSAPAVLKERWTANRMYPCTPHPVAWIEACHPNRAGHRRSSTGRAATKPAAAAGGSAAARSASRCCGSPA
jgi:hypothetical protein